MTHARARGGSMKRGKATRALVVVACASFAASASASSGMLSAVLRATGKGTGEEGQTNSNASEEAQEYDANAQESATAGAIRRGARVRLTRERASELANAPMMAIYGGLGDRGETLGSIDVLAGSSSGDYLVWCHERGNGASEAGLGKAERSSEKEEDDERGEEVFSPLPLASVGSAVYGDGRRALFHGGYKIWNGGSEFSDVSSTTAFDMDAGAFTCLTERENDDDDDDESKSALGAAGNSCPKLGGDRTGKRDEEVAVITSKPIYLPEPTEARATAALGAIPALGKHLSMPELPALDVEDDATESSKIGKANGKTSASGDKQHAMIIFGGRDENDERLDTVYALGLDDKKWRKIEYELAPERKDMVPQGPFEMPLIVKNEHAQGKPFPLGRSGASAVVTPDNKMVIYGGFVVEGKLGFNVGETLVLDLDTMKFSYPRVSGSIPVRRNKHTAVLDDKKQMWVWGGSVWDHTGGSSTYASTATYRADLGDTDDIVWHRVETKGKPPSQRRFHSAIIMDGGMYIIGGEDYRTRTYMSDVHRLDLETLTWTQPAVLGGIEGGRIRAAAFPWFPAKVKDADTVDKNEPAVKPSLGKSKSHRKDLDDDEDKNAKTSKDENEEEEQAAQSSIIDITTCGNGEPARVRTGENQPDIETLISALIDGSTLGSSSDNKKNSKGETIATLAANLAASGWIPNTARGSSILSESSMVWKKVDTASVGSSDSLPGWITDKGQRDSSILLETLQADPEADSIEARLIQAVKASKKDSDDSARVGEHEHTASKKDDDEDKDDDRHHQHSDDDKSDEDDDHRRASSKSNDDDDDEDAHRHSSAKNDDDDDDEDLRRRRSSNDEDDGENSRSHHASSKDEDDEDRDARTRHEERDSKSSHRNDEDDEDDKPPRKLSAAAKLIEKMSRGHEATLGTTEDDTALLGRVENDEETVTDANGTHAYLALGVLAFVAAIAAGRQTFGSPRAVEETSTERIPLVANSITSSDVSPSRATWQKEAAKRRGVQFGFISSDGEADELC